MRVWEEIGLTGVPLADQAAKGKKTRGGNEKARCNRAIRQKKGRTKRPVKSREETPKEGMPRDNVNRDTLNIYCTAKKTRAHPRSLSLAVFTAS